MAMEEVTEGLEPGERGWWPQLDLNFRLYAIDVVGPMDSTLMIVAKGSEKGERSNVPVRWGPGT